MANRTPSSGNPRAPSAGLIVGGILLMVVVIGGGLTALALSGSLDFLFRAAAPHGPTVVAAAPTLPPAWTPTPSPAATASATPTVFQSPTPRPTLALLELDPAARALQQMWGQNYRGAVESWGEVIQADQQNHQAYYGRAYSYLWLASQSGMWGEVVGNSLAALTDLDQAIALSPELNGDYFLARAWAFENLGVAERYRVDHDRLIEAALENLEVGISLPHSEPLASYDAARLLLRLGRCNEALQEAERLDRERGAGLAPSPNLNYYKGVALLCTGRYQEGLDALIVARNAFFSCDYEYQQAVALYLLGRTDEAVDKTGRLITACLAHGGNGYYLRALILFDLGQTGSVASYLERGYLESGDYWGLKAYVEGLMLAEQGNVEEAVGRLQQAEETFQPIHGPFLARIRRDLAALGGRPVSHTPESWPEATPIPPLPADHPTPLPIRRVVHNEGSGEIPIDPGETVLLHFRGPQGFTISRARLLHVYLVPIEAAGPLELDMQLFDPHKQWWEDFQLRWGQNAIGSPDRFFYGSGDLFIKLHNPGPEHVIIHDLGLDLTVLDDYGELATWTFLDR